MFGNELYVLPVIRFRLLVRLNWFISEAFDVFPLLGSGQEGRTIALIGGATLNVFQALLLSDC
jgi:hypothetical protein